MILDAREHALIKAIPPSLASTKQLPVADIWIGVKEDGQPAANGLLIERKAVADLESSILDGRYREQRARLLAFAAESGAHPVYIIEGDLDRMGPSVRLAEAALLKHLTRLMLRYHIAVFQTASVQDTAKLLLLLQDQWTSDPTTFEQPAKLSYVEAAGGGKKSANRDDPGVFAVAVLQQCRGISAAAALAILEANGGTLEGIWSRTVEELAQTPVSEKRKLGKAVAARLVGLLHPSLKIESKE